MAKLIMCKGLPASGKTTFAKQYVLDHPGAVRINKDEIRDELHGGVWSKENEKEVIAYRNENIKAALSKGADVLVDDTNLAPKHEATLRGFAEVYNAEFEVKDFTGISPEICVVRDLGREKRVGKEVIMKMYNQFLKKRDRGTPLVPFGDRILPECVIFDLDGTLACIGDRSPYDGKSCGKDLPNWSVITLNKWVPMNTNIILFSGRSETARKETLDWLDKYNVSFDALYMREDGDNRKDSIVKEEMFNRYIKDKYRVIFAVDDRKSIVDLWRSLGITCLQVAEGDF